MVELEPHRSRELFSEALELSTSLGVHEGVASAVFGLGESARVTGSYLEAIKRYSAALKLTELHSDMMLHGRCLRRLGDIQYYLTNLDLSLRYYLQALRVFESAGQSEGMPDTRLQVGHLLSTIGNVLKGSGDLTGAMDYYSQSLEVYQREGYSDGIPGVRYNIGTVMQEQGCLDDAETAYRETLEQAVGRGDEYLTSLSRNSLGSVFLARGDFEQAEHHFQKSLETSRRMNRKRGVLSSLLKMMELRRNQRDHQAALEMSVQAESLSKELGDKGMLGDVLRGRAAVLEMAGDHLGAYKTLCVYLEIQQEQMSEKRVRQIDALRLYYETEERERKIEQLNLTNRNLVRAYSRVEEQMRTDALTGLANRRAALEWLSSQQEHFKVTGIGFGLILADIDGFKYCNDLLGHECGDAILIQLANRLHRTLRKRDLSVRWGGEEFLILLPETSLEEAAHVAETVRACIEAEPFTANRTDIPITMTFGVSQGGELPNDAVIRLADQAMYRGKRLGKNRVEVAAALIEP